VIKDLLIRPEAEKAIEEAYHGMKTKALVWVLNFCSVLKKDFGASSGVRKPIRWFTETCTGI
jgi:hypothetical protein